MFNLSRQEERLFRKLNRPDRIQDFLDELPINFESDGFTYLSPRRVLRERRAHCAEGALLAAAALWYHGGEPLLLDLKTTDNDADHVVALFKQRGYWGAISKTNHATLRFRDPVYKTVRELVLSYFHEYFLNETGEKTLRSYSRPFNIKKFGTSWVTAEEDLDEIVEALDASRHVPLLSRFQSRQLRRATPLEREAGTVVQFHP